MQIRLVEFERAFQALPFIMFQHRREERNAKANSVNFPRQLISLGNVKYLNVADYYMNTKSSSECVCVHTIPGDSNYKVSDEYHYAKYIAQQNDSLTKNVLNFSWL